MIRERYTKANAALDGDRTPVVTSWPSNAIGISAPAAARCSGSRSEVLEEGSWYCLRCRRHQEMLTASYLRVLPGVAIFCPRIRFKRIYRKTATWVNEAWFPGHFFVRVKSERVLTEAPAIRGIFGIVKLGGRYAVVPDEVIRKLRDQSGATRSESFASALVPGERTRVRNGVARDMDVVILQILPAGERMKLFRRFLEQQAASDNDLLPSIPNGFEFLNFAARVGVQSARRGVRKEVHDFVSPTEEPRLRPKRALAR
jgi:transcription antitermination factor NusG